MTEVAREKLINRSLALFVVVILHYALLRYAPDIGDWFVLFIALFMGYLSAWFVQTQIRLGAISRSFLSFLISSVLMIVYWNYYLFLKRDVFEIIHDLDTGILFSIYIFVGILKAGFWGLVFSVIGLRVKW